LEVERGFSAHMKGTFIAPPQFNQDNCNKPLSDFFRNIDKVKEDHWSSILQFSGEDENSYAGSDILQGDQSIVTATISLHSRSVLGK
ncbi:hypothetical protein BYT27DRAFT_7120426, partial [Phlegmacium glaucopus]